MRLIDADALKKTLKEIQYEYLAMQYARGWNDAMRFIFDIKLGGADNDKA